MEISFSISSVKAILASDKEDNILHKQYYQKDGALSEYLQNFDLDYIPILERRRLGKASKCVMSLLKNSKEPVVFASYRGEINRSLDLLFDLAKLGAVSPTSFSLSVLNATPAVASIMHKNHSEITAISASPALENGIVQAYINLQTNNYDRILLISYYEGEFKDYYNIDSSFYVLLMMIEKGNSITLKREAKEEKVENSNFALVSDLLFLDKYKKKENYCFNMNGIEWSYSFK